jgi:hypothetical protein
MKRPKPNDVLREVQTKHWKPPYYTSAASLGIKASSIKIRATIMLAEIEGWLMLGGNPAHSLAVTASGIAQLDRQRKA